MAFGALYSHHPGTASWQSFNKLKPINADRVWTARDVVSTSLLGGNDSLMLSEKWLDLTKHIIRAQNQNH